MGNSPKEPAEAGRMLGEGVCCPQEGALRKAWGQADGPPGGPALKGFRHVGGVGGGGQSCQAESSLRFSLQGLLGLLGHDSTRSAGW